jgi:hypothetical protein
MELKIKAEDQSNSPSDLSEGIGSCLRVVASPMRPIPDRATPQSTFNQYSTNIQPTFSRHELGCSPWGCDSLSVFSAMKVATLGVHRQRLGLFWMIVRKKIL